MTPSLALGADREAALHHAADLVARAWREFDRPRDHEPPLPAGLRDYLARPLPEAGEPVITGLDRAAQVLDASLAQARPRFFAFVGSSGLEVGALADLLAHSYDVNLAVDARAASRLEQQALAWVGQFLGFPYQVGSFTSGGTISNITALAAARERAVPGARVHGLGATRPTLYCSAEAHYSVTRAAEMLGLGSGAVRAIGLDEHRRMRPDALAEAVAADVAAGRTPVAVVATAGTTLTGAVDPIDAIADVCARFGVWLHIDGAYGVPAAATPAAAARFAGLHRADSVTVDAHKWMFVPKAASVVLVRAQADLVRTFAHDEAYVPHDGGHFNAVDLTLEYSRPLRALKVWLALAVHGAGAFRDAIERNLAQAGLLYDLAAAHPDLDVLAHRPQLSITPIRWRRAGCADLDAHNAGLTTRLQHDGRVFVSPATIDGAVWLRPCFTNFRTTDDDVRVLVDVVSELGADCAACH